jgi:hypothetical protein
MTNRQIHIVELPKAKLGPNISASPKAPCPCQVTVNSS